jgi:Spy/CpxP family protein refolding chaperone
MDMVSRNKWQVRVAALVIFLLGAAAGALAPRAYYAWARSGEGGRASRGERFEQMLDERLRLGDEQKTQVREILGDSRSQLEALRRESEPRMQEVRRQADERLQKVLTPEQWQQFQQLKDEMRGPRRRGGRGQRGGGGPPHEEKR